MITLTDEPTCTVKPSEIVFSEADLVDLRNFMTRRLAEAVSDTVTDFLCTRRARTPERPYLVQIVTRHYCSDVTYDALKRVVDRWEGAYVRDEVEYDSAQEALA